MKFKSKKDIIEYILKQNSIDNEFLRSSKFNFFRNDFAVVKEVLLKNGKNYFFIDKSLQKNKELLLIALETSGEAFSYADISLRNDKDIAKIAIKKNYNCVKYLSTDLKKDKDLAFYAMEVNPKSFPYFDKSIREDKKIVLKGLKNESSIFKSIKLVFKKDREVIFCAIKKDSNVFNQLEEDLKKDREIILESLISLKNNVSPMLQIYKAGSYILNIEPKELKEKLFEILRKNDLDFLIETVQYYINIEKNYENINTKLEVFLNKEDKVEKIKKI